MDRPRPSRSPLLAQRLVALALLAALLFTVPLLMPWLQGAPLAGWPRWAWALLGLWAVLIGLLALLMERSADEGAPP
jgi:hypothetical protein